ncbi:hypothetical protein [Thermoclostridium caenicola]|uniref:Uncharacterized protein n=1 Tax=Thermoclostridium caenicola TaxID=659425 RepID=A0A1M6CHG6_9FIRM|nr:hypothetical protein [Thermoclostridium caenicola]SHI60447.1 hypothetical protein SAMN05444373_100524 [Thermoclostridium caenicola]
MKREDIRRAIDRIAPGPDAEKRMLAHILQKTGETERKASRTAFSPRRAIPVLAMSAMIVAGALIWSLSSGGLLTGNPGEKLQAGDSIGAAPREDAVYVLKDQFQLSNRHYILLREEQRAEFGLPDTIKDEDIGEKIATITTSVDESLIGLEVYRYTPAGGEAVVAVKKETGYQLFNFMTFESYLNNQDEDAKAYLELYGIYSAEDIARIRFIGHSERAKLEGRTEILAELTDRQKIKTFYDFYSVIPNSSDRYFEKLFSNTGAGRGNVDAVPDPTKPGSKGMEIPPMPPEHRDGGLHDRPDAPVSIRKDEVPEAKEVMPSGYAEDLPTVYPVAPADTPNAVGQGSTQAGYAGSAGTNALENPVTIRIYNRSGVYMETVYYPNIGFISRHEVNEAFAAFLKECLGM